MGATARLKPGQLCCVALGRAHDDLGPHRRVRRRDPTRFQAYDRGSLIDGNALAYDGGGESTSELGRVDPRAIRGVGAAEDVRRVESRPSLVPEQEGEAEAVVVRLDDLVAGATELQLGAGEHDRAALDEVTVDALGGGRPADLVDRSDHRPVHRDRRSPTVPPGERADRLGEQRRAPAAVAAGRAESGDLFLQHRDPQRRIGRGEVIRGPQSGEAGADDRHVDVDVAGERRARRQVVVDRGHPVRQRAVVGQRHVTLASVPRFWRCAGRRAFDAGATEVGVL